MLKDKTFTYRGHTFQVRARLLEKAGQYRSMQMRNRFPRRTQQLMKRQSIMLRPDGGMLLKLLCILLRPMWKKNIFQR